MHSRVLEAGLVFMYFNYKFVLIEQPSHAKSANRFGQWVVG